MDDAGSEHAGGWVLVRDGLDRGGRRRRRAREPRTGSTSAAHSSRRASSTPTTTSTRRSRAPARRTRRCSSGWSSCTRCGRGSTPRPSTPRRARAWPSSRSRAARPCSTTTTSSRAGARASSRPSCRPRASSACASSPRAARWTSARRRAACRPTRSSRRSTRSWPTPSASPRSPTATCCRSRSRPCSPFSVTRQLMVESAALARRLGLRLHTHLAETADEDEFCRERYGCTPVEYLVDVGWLGDDVWCAHCVHVGDGDLAHFAAHGVGVAHCPASNLRLGAGVAPVREMLDAGVARRPRRRRLGLQRARRPDVRGQAGAARRPRPRRAARR